MNPSNFQVNSLHLVIQEADKKMAHFGLTEKISCELYDIHADSFVFGFIFVLYIHN